MDPSKYKKLSDYAALLTQQAEAEEKSKDYAYAIEKYLKTVDVLLVMSEAAPNYPSWVQCTTRADSIQKKIKTLIALASLKEERESQTPKPVESSKPQAVSVQRPPAPN